MEEFGLSNCFILWFVYLDIYFFENEKENKIRMGFYEFNFVLMYGSLDLEICMSGDYDYLDLFFLGIIFMMFYDNLGL